jgi:hypothetical protein
MKEIWKDVVGYEGLYQVSNLGNVNAVDRYVPCKGSMAFRAGREVYQMMHWGNYRSVTLWKDNKRKVFRVHRLVGIAFLPNPFNKATINHIDSNPANNVVTNLEWATQSENNSHAYAMGRIPAQLGKRNEQIRTSRAIVQTDICGRVLREYPSISEAKRHGYSTPSIHDALSKRRIIFKKTMWFYKKDFNESNNTRIISITVS